MACSGIGILRQSEVREMTRIDISANAVYAVKYWA